MFREWYGPLLQDLEDRGLVDPREIGHGGMGHVLRVWDTELDRPIAVKVITQLAARRPANIRRFQTEMRLLGQIRHPSIVTVYGGRMNDDFAYFLMSYVQGGNLRHHLDHRRTVGLPFSIRETVDCLRPIAEALDAIHHMNPPVIHRDIKPANILIPDNDDGLKASVLTDFGISQVIGDPRLTQVGTVIGSERYLAPERYNETTAGPLNGIRSDNYALALVACEMLTLTPLFTTMSLEQWRFGARPLRIDSTSLAPGDRRQAEALTGLFQWLLSPEPSHRPSSAVAAVDSLAALTTAGGAVRSLGPVPASAHRPRPPAVPVSAGAPEPAGYREHPDHRDHPDIPDLSDYSLPPESRPVPTGRPRPSPPPAERRQRSPSPAGDVTGSTGHSTVARFRRRRISLVATGVLLVLAVAAVFLTVTLRGAEADSDTGGTATTTGPTWPVTHADLVDEFPRLLPPRPGTVSDLGFMCDPSPPSDGQLVVISCHGDSSTITLARYPTIALRDEHHPGHDPGNGTERCAGMVTVPGSADTTLLLPRDLPVSITVAAPTDTVHAFLDELCPEAGKPEEPQTFQL